MGRVVVRIAIVLGCAGAGIVAALLLAALLVFPTIGTGDTAALIFNVMAVVGAISGALLSARVRLDDGSNEPETQDDATSDEEPAEFSRFSMGARVVVLLAGACGQIFWIVSEDLGGLIWFPIAGLVAVALALTTLGESGSSKALKALAFLTGVPMLMLLPLFGLGLLLAPAALSLLVASWIPSHRRVHQSSETHRRDRILKIVLGILFAALILYLSRPVAGYG